MRHFRARCETLFYLCAAFATGCGAPVLSVDDGLVGDGDRTVRVNAYVEREGALGLRPGIARERVEVFLDGDAGTSGETDGTGCASIECTLPAGKRLRTVRATCVVDGKALECTGRLFRLRRDRTIIAVDIDDTISDTEFDDLLTERRDSESDPISGSRRGLEELAEDFQLIYLTARPRGLHGTTRRWLEEHKYPAGPIVVSARSADVIHQSNYRQRALSELRLQFPNLLIGIADRTGDARAQAANGMMSVLIREEPPLGELPANTLVFEKWRHARRFFESYRRELGDPRRLEERIRQNRISLWRDDRRRD